jgi:hypothetical protein
MLVARTCADSTEVMALDGEVLVEFLEGNFTSWKPSDDEKDEDAY